MDIDLKPIDETNWRECIALKLKDDQEDLLATNEYSLIQAKYECRFYKPTGIFFKKKMVGFLMYGKPPKEDMWISRFMIDKKYQKMGYGRSALEKLLNKLKKEGHSKIITSYLEGNKISKKLFESFGFIETGEIDAEDGGKIMRLKQ